MAERIRNTKETKIRMTIERSGDTGSFTGSSGIGFFDHMLTALAVHGGLVMTLDMTGDLEVDCHHTIEDCGIVLGQVLAELFGDKSAVTRYGSAFIPMDEALGFCALDISGRPYLVFDGTFSGQYMGTMETAMVEEFFRAVAFNAGLTLHLRLISGKNDHHKTEALFKAFAHALCQAMTPRSGGVLSTKGVLA